MKRKYFSALLMASLALASTSMVTSCKDYDDDINGLKQEISKNATTLDGTVTANKTALEAELGTLKTQQSALEKSLENAKTTLNAAIEAAKTDANKYADVQAAAAQQAAIAAAKANVDSAVATIEAALEAANKRIDEVKATADSNATKIAALLEADKELENAIAQVKAEAAQAASNAKDAADKAQAAADKAQGTADAAAAAAAENATKLTQVSKDLETVKTDLQGQITALGTLVSQNITDIADNKAAADAQFESVTKLIEANKTAIEGLKDADEDMLKKINENSKDLAALAKIVSANKTACDANLESAKEYARAQVADLKEIIMTALASKANQENLDKTDAKLDSVAKVLGQAQLDIAGAVAKIDANEKAIKAVKGYVGNMDSLEVDGAEDLVSAVNKLNSAIDENNINFGLAILSLQQEMQQTYAKASELDIVKKDLADLKANAATKKELKDAIDALESSLSGKIDDVKDDLEKELGDLADKLGDYVTSKDFDLEIKGIKDAADKLEDRVGTAENNITDLQKKVADIEKDYAKTTAVEEAVKEAKEGLQEGINELRNKIAEITGEENYEKSLRASVDSLASALSDVAKDLDTHKGEFTTLKDAFEEYKKTNGEVIYDIYDQIEDANEFTTQVLNLAQYHIDVLAGYSKQLKSLVFSPTEYYQGIEAIGIYSYNYKAYKELPAYDAEKDQVGVNNPTTVDALTSVVPDVTAEYYMNPSNATVDTDLSHYKFLVNNAKYTRAANASDITIKSVEKKDGKACITFGMKNANKISKIDKWSDVSSVDVAALQYTYKSEESKNDTTITSDWAALKNYNVTKFQINKASAAGKTEEKNEEHLAATAAIAITANNAGVTGVPYLEIQYDNTEGIDLDQWINVHYNYGSDNESVWGGQETVNEKGFKLVYSLVGYIAAGHDTNESAHAKLDGSKLTLQGYKGAEAGRQIIGRTPLVRVTLVDENTNKQIASVGYILVKITDKQIKPETVTADAIQDKYTVKCLGNALDNVQAITWEEVENKVCAKLGVSKTEFEANWTFDEVNQYVQNAKGEFATATEKFGTVIKTTEDEGGHQTNVLKWTVSNGDAYTYFVTKGNTSKSIWVKFTPTKTTDTPVYVQLTWTPSAINKTPEAEILNSTAHKKAAAWHENFTELHVQPGNATVKGATCDYVNLVVANTFNVAPETIVKNALNATYPELSAKAAVEYVFAPTSQQTTKSIKGLSGTTYTITSDGENIKANNTVIATISKNDVDEGIIGIVKNGVMEDIINSGKNLMTLTVMAKATTCDPATNLINFKNNKFDVRVITPLFVEGGVIKDMQLNNASTLTQPVTLKFTDFNAYTESQFLANSNNNVIFKTYYGIESIKQVGTIMTNYSGAKKAVDPNDFTITYKEGSLKTVGGVMTDMGSITLTQKNQSRNNGFKVWVPVEVTYKWGTVKTEIELDVQAASQAARRH